MNKIFTFLIFSSVTFFSIAQNKKEQIEELNYKIDSLMIANSQLISTLVAKENTITENQNLIKKNQEAISELNKIQESNKKTNSELEQNIITINENNTKLITQNDQLKRTIDSLNTILKSSKAIKYSLKSIDGSGPNCNCGCKSERKSNGNWEYMGTWACEVPESSGSKVINDYLNSFWIIIEENQFTLQIENKVAINGKLLSLPVRNKEIILYESATCNYMFRDVSEDGFDSYAILFGTFEANTDIKLIHAKDNTIVLTFNDFGTHYNLTFSID
jgi:hypothetical protein